MNFHAFEFREKTFLCQAAGRFHPAKRERVGQKTKKNLSGEKIFGALGEWGDVGSHRETRESGPREGKFPANGADPRQKKKKKTKNFEGLFADPPVSRERRAKNF
jgi:hypothetical protein